MVSRVDFDLSFIGAEADEHLINFYDVAEALMGFERSIAITTHLVLNGEVITHAPALKGATVLTLPPEAGSWRIKAAVVIGIGTAIMNVNNAPKDTPIGNLVRSVYSYVIHETLGFNVNFEETLGQQIEEYGQAHPRPERRPLEQSQVDSVIEKCRGSIRSIHRPIYSSQTAICAEITSDIAGQFPVLDLETFDYVNYTREDDRPTIVEGRVSSYNINTFRGRLFSFSERRSIPFRLAEHARDTATVDKIVRSLSANAVSRLRGVGDLRCSAYVQYSRTDAVKSYTIIAAVDLH